MSWHTVITTQSEFTEFRDDLNREFCGEIAGGQLGGYTLFVRKRDAGDYLLFVPPAAAVLFERLPSWQKRLRPYKNTPYLKDFEAVPLH